MVVGQSVPRIYRPYHDGAAAVSRVHSVTLRACVRDGDGRQVNRNWTAAAAAAAAKPAVYECD